MPVGSDPDDLIVFVLLTDQGKTPKPTFLIRFQSERESRKVARLIDQASAETNPEKEGELLDEVASIGLAGLQNVTFRGEPVAWPGTPPASLGEFLSLNERWELAGAILNQPHLQETDRKKSLRQSTSASAGSAETAAPPIDPAPGV